MEVKLSEMEIRMAALVGLERYLKSRASSLQDAHGYNQVGASALVNDITAACAEVACAKGLKRYWGGPVGNFKGPDVGKYQVRYTDRVDGCLIIRTNDDDLSFFILVTGNIPQFNIRGYIQASVAKGNSIWLQDPNERPEAWFVPQSELTPIGSILKKEAYGEKTS